MSVVQVLLFAHPRELLNGVLFVTLNVPVGNDISSYYISDARKDLSINYPILSEALLLSCSFAVGDELVLRETENTTLCGIEIALIPPVSGG